MKLAIQYVNDSHGKLRAIQLPLPEWKKILNTLSKYEQALKIKTELSDAFDEVKKMRKGTLKKQSLTEFLNGI